MSFFVASIGVFSKLMVMKKELRRANCTNTEWLGRADCGHCHIRDLMLFSGLPETAFDETLQPIDHFIFPPRTVLYEARETSGFIFSLRRGLVKLLHLAPDGTQRIVRLLGAGAAVGLELLDGGGGYRHTAVTVDEVDACRIPLATVKTLQSMHPVLCNQIRVRLQDHLDRADEWITVLGTGPARERIAHLLVMLSKLSASPKGDFALLGREDMAAIVGTRTETVSRIVADFKRRELLYKTEDGLHRCNKEALQAISGQRTA